MKIPFIKKKEQKEPEKSWTPKVPKHRKIKKKQVVSILCFALAAVLAFGVLPMLYSQKEEVGTVVQVASYIKKGDTIASNQVQEKDLPLFGQPKDTLTESSSAVGKIAKVDMLPGDSVTKQKIGDYVSNPVLEGITKEGKQLVTLTLPTIASGLAIPLQKGDIVSVYTVQELDGGAVSVQLDPTLKEVEVYALENSSAQKIDFDQKADSGADQVATSITFVATPEQASKLVTAEYSGKVHVVFVRKGEE